MSMQRIISLLMAVMIVVPAVLSGQANENVLKPGSLRDIQTPIPQLSDEGDEQILEQPIDPDKYFIGPGDVISVNIWSSLEQRFVLTVSPEGILSIPTVGNLKIDGLPLSSAKEIVIASVRRIYNSGEITVQLIRLRKFRIPVAGVISFPGVYNASAADRVSHLLEKAGGLIIPDKKYIKRDKAAKKQEEIYSSLRNIELISAAGDTIRVDFLMFARSLEAQYNPFINQGDAIYIPALSEEIGTIEINGAVNIPGRIEHAQGDRISDIIKVSGGLRDDAKMDAVVITRCKGNSADFETFHLSLLNREDWDFSLEADDRILVKSIYDYHLRHQVTVSGEVKYPGVYSIVEKESRLSELVEMAGGFTAKANLEDSRIIRTAEEEITDPEFERLKLIPVADMTEMEYEYFKTKSREKAYVVTDFKALFIDGDKSQNIYLRNNDEIEIPIQAKTVQVSGQVLNPGLIEWNPGKNYEYYIEKCGGYSYNARKSKTRIIRASTGTWMKPNSKTLINIGDTIFIPEKPERDYWIIYKDLLLVASQMVTIIVLVATVSR